MNTKSVLEEKQDISAEETPKKVSSVNAILKKFIILPLPQIKYTKKSGTSKIFYIIGLICTLFLPLYMNFAMEYIYRGSFEACFDYLSLYPYSAIFSTLMLSGFFWILWLIFRKGSWAAFIFILLCSTLALANHFKHSLTGDFIYPWDLINQTENLGELTGFINMGIPANYVVVLVVGFMFPIISFFFKSEIPLRIFPRLFLVLAISFSIFFSFNTPEKTAKTLERFDMVLNSTAEQETNHMVNGFSGGFIVNCLSMNITEPEGYSREKIHEILKNYPPQKAKKSFSSPDIILVLSESFWDPRLIPGTKFSKNPLESFDEISDKTNAYSGNMYQTAFGGGTVRTEFEVLTGLTTDTLPVGTVPWQYISQDTPTYATTYKELGYRTVFMHTFSSAFYMRSKAYPLLGFEELYFIEDLESIKDISYTVSGNYVSDDSFMDYLIYLLEKEDDPCFLFGITMENHQPFEDKYQNPTIEVENPKLSKDSVLSLENYATGISNADKALSKLINYIDNRERDTVLIYFGDHLPTIGADKAALKESGFISEGEMTDKEWQAIMRTPFLIYGNFPLNESSMLKKGDKNNISSYNLLNAAADLIGAPKSSLMEFLKDYYGAMPYYNSRLKLKPNKAQQQFINSHNLLTYDMVDGDRYMLGE